MNNDAFEVLRQMYRERATVHVDTLEQALGAGDRATVSTIAHKLRGSGASFGFPELSAIAEPVELAAEGEASADELGRLAEPLLSELRRIAQAV